MMRATQTPSAFAAPLAALCELADAVHAAVLVDDEGERVDHAVLASAPAHDDVQHAVALAGAHLQIVLRDTRAAAAFRAATTLWIATSERAFVAHHVHAGYVLAVMGEPSLVGTLSHRSLGACAAAIAREAGWRMAMSDEPVWERARGRTDSAGHPLEIVTDTKNMPALHAHELRPPRSDERRYRIDHEPRLELVRESSGAWFVAEKPPQTT